MGSFSAWHWLIIALLFVLLFGAKRLPDAARGVGRSLRIFKSEVSQMQSESGDAKKSGPDQPETAAPQQLAPGTASADTTSLTDPQPGQKTV